MRKMFQNIDRWLIEHPVFTDLMTILVPCLFFIVLGIISNSCSTIKEIPVQTVEKIVYRDSTIYLNDTIQVPVPYEVTKEILPELDTSYLETSVARSTAYLDTSKRQIYHDLIQEGKVEVIYDTLVQVQYVDRIVEKEVPIVQEVEVPKYDTFFFVLLGFAAVIILRFILSMVVR